MAPKRKTKNAAVVAVVDTITESEALPADLRSLLGGVLPSILNTYKVDRHAFEAEVVAQAGEALSIVGKARADELSAALAKQNALIAPAERLAREAAEKAADDKQKQAQSHVESCDAAKKESDKSVSDAEHGVKVAQKDETAAEKIVQKTSQKKSTLEGALTSGFAALAAGVKKSEKDAAIRQITALCKENGVGSTCLQAFHLACNSDASSRSEFESMTLTTVKEKLEEALKAISKQLEDETAAVEQKKAETAAAKEKLAAAETVQTTAIETLAAAKESQKEAKKAYSQAVAHRLHVWDEMKAACDAQDDLAKSLKNFKEVILPAFEEAKEKVAPPPEVEPVEEPAEKKQRTEEEAATIGQGNAD